MTTLESPSEASLGLLPRSLASITRVGWRPEEIGRVVPAPVFRQAAELRYADHVEHVLGQLDTLISRTKEIDRLRSVRRSGRPKDHSELVAALRTRLTAVLSLLN